MANLSKEEYITIKTKAYELASTLAKEEIEGLINFINSKNIKNSGEKEIFISTLLYPNDMDVIIEREENHVHDIKGLEKATLIPTNILILKLSEYAAYGTIKLLEENKELRRLAEQASQFDGRYEMKK